MDTEIVLNVTLEPLDEGGFVATSSDLPGLVVQGRTRAETMAPAQANARILMEVDEIRNIRNEAAAPGIRTLTV